MFNKNEFNAMLARHGMSKSEFADFLGIRRETLYRRLTNGGLFTYPELCKMVERFGIDDVKAAFFSC